MTNKTKRDLCFALTILFSFVIPATVVVIKYHMVEAFMHASTSVQLSIMGCIIILIMALCNIKKITTFINNIEFSIMKCIISGAFKMIPLICILLLLTNMNLIINDLTYITYWIVASNAISLFIFDPLWKYYNEESKFDREHNARRKRDKLDAKEKN